MDRQPHQRRLWSIFCGSVGNLVEWYDWYVYSAFALYFAKAFFPPASQTAQLLNAAAVFAVGFLMRPLGGWVLGWYADRHGRRAALTASVLLMSVGSFIIAVTPSYATIGKAAPTLLIIARLCQGISVGGEYGASATYLSEMAGKERRGFYSSFQYVTLIAGQLVALAVLIVLQHTLTSNQLDAWGWRVPFALGAGLALVAVWLRRALAETHAFRMLATTGSSEDALRAGRHSPLRSLFAHPRQVATVVGVTAGGTVAFYTFTTYAQKFLVNTGGWSKSDATLMSAASLALFTLVQPLVGWLSDHVGRRPILIAFGVAGSVGTVPIMTALGTTKSSAHAFLLLTLALIIVSGYTAINAVVKAELFPTEVRAIGVALPYAVAVSVFGGTAEYVALRAKSAGHEPWFYWYVTACIVASLVVYVVMPDTRATSRIVDA
ncbi:MAG: MFS transporter [Gemmatimonadaceae bacterium]